MLMVYLLSQQGTNSWHQMPCRFRAVELGRPPEKRHEMQIEIPNHIFCRYLFESMGIDLPLTPQEIDRVFWDAAAPGVPTEGISGFLRFLAEHGIRTGVISNISYCGAALAERIGTLLPNHGFEFILATSDYIFRKPNPRIFDLALEKAELQPQEVWYIGDNYDCDIFGARNAGMYPVWYTGALRGKPIVEDEVLTVTHWRELEKMIQNLEEYK